MQHVGRLGTLVGFALQILAAAAALIFPDEKWIGWTLAGFGVAVFIATIVWWLRTNRIILKNGVRVEPIYILAIGLLLTAVGASWLMVRQTSKPPVIVVQAPSPPQTFSQPARLVANELPPIPQETASQVARYVQLKDLIGRAEATKTEFEINLPPLLGVMRPTNPQRLSPIFYSRAMTTYSMSLETFTSINNAAYANRSIDFKSAPALVNPLVTAPFEEEFGDNKDGQYKYRLFHYQAQNATTQYDALIGDMKNEFSQLERTVSHSQAKNILTK